MSAVTDTSGLESSSLSFDNAAAELRFQQRQHSLRHQRKFI